MAEVAKARSTKTVFDRKAFPAERTVFNEGDAGQCTWFIETGRVAIMKERLGDRVLLGILGPGEIFAEMALIDDAPRMATATTVEPTVLVPIAREYLQSRLAEADPFIARLITILVQNVRSITDRHIESLEPTPPITGFEAGRAYRDWAAKTARLRLVPQVGFWYTCRLGDRRRLEGTVCLRDRGRDGQ